MLEGTLTLQGGRADFPQAGAVVAIVVAVHVVVAAKAGKNKPLPLELTKSDQTIKQRL